MQHIEIQRTPTAYTLRFSRQTRTAYLVLASLLFPLGMTASATPWLVYGVKPPASMIFISIYTGIFAIGAPLFLICRGLGFRMVADTQGVHCCSFGRVKRTLLWRHVRSCGIGEIPPSANEGRVIPPSFYVSTERPVQSMKSCLFIRLQSKEDQQAFRASGLLSFCHTQMAEADRKFK